MPTRMLQLPGDFTLNYFEAENPETMKDITVEQLTKGKKVGHTCFGSLQGSYGRGKCILSAK
jgi:hypothetical protein